jgi:hypothetical protein
MVDARKRVEDVDNAEQVIHYSLSLHGFAYSKPVYSIALDSCLAVRGLVGLLPPKLAVIVRRTHMPPPLLRILLLSGTLSHFILG